MRDQVMLEPEVFGDAVARLGTQLAVLLAALADRIRERLPSRTYPTAN